MRYSEELMFLSINKKVCFASVGVYRWGCTWGTSLNISVLSPSFSAPPRPSLPASVSCCVFSSLSVHQILLLYFHSWGAREEIHSHARWIEERRIRIGRSYWLCDRGMQNTTRRYEEDFSSFSSVFGGVYIIRSSREIPYLPSWKKLKARSGGISCR